MAGRDLVTGPSPQEKVKADPLTHIAIRTILGAYYTVPDMTMEMVHEMLDHVNRDVEQLVVRNLSEATLVIPTRIIAGIYRLEIGSDSECHATSPQGGMEPLWVP